jgi:hypothetical protein
VLPPPPPPPSSTITLPSLFLLRGLARDNLEGFFIRDNCGGQFPHQFHRKSLSRLSGEFAARKERYRIREIKISPSKHKKRGEANVIFHKSLINIGSAIPGY